MRIIILTTPILFLAFSALAYPIAATAQTDAPKPAEDRDKPLSFWMEKKIEYTQDMLRGLVGGDLDAVAEKAEQMRLLSKVEGWIRGKKPGYRAQLQVFEFANNEMLRQSRRKNLEGTTMAFQQLTAACVSCHRILRETNGDAHAAGNRKSAD